MTKTILGIAAVALCAALAGCADNESAEAVAMEQFKASCKGGNLQACNAILTREQQNRASAAAASATMAGAAPVGTGY